MGNCATMKQTTNLCSAAQLLKSQYEQMINQIKASRNILIKQFVKDLEDQKEREEDFSFMQDLKLVKENCRGIELKYQFSTVIHQLQEIESKFQLLENIQKNELERRVAKGIDINQKTKKILNDASKLRVIIYDYFYSDLEVTDVPNELI
ncbi:hypothetical protein TTHERM_00299980 (macronuclear) [Tetrahymena thermophila SB210]|uniref:Uncharacterized protein n=1 Tax=Tetrahymena thermophila (strain SB210) TaxID=312017 RepID=I7MM70_TETTS|nr:hypothetical protein TTHERM_00299980 [Tetrahymena thermophila SB210]EAS04280.1 hypothetical protein TTHERM_00299980 [Tetrahymena thermophila SB210]|eukprot:XP_001024525.1 hypothetical protein TTHERM_00299980 [Tetrahymena thermophila SB210]